MVAEWMNLLRGTVTVTAEGAYPERLLNLCAQNGVTFWGSACRGEYQIIFTTRRGDLARVRQLAERIGCTLRVGRGVGLPFFLGRLRTRYAFLLGLGCAVGAVLILSNFVLSIEVKGNESVSSGEILAQLRQQGLTVGVYGPDVDRVAMAQEALMELDALSWMAINRCGTRMEVLVRERVRPPDIPSIEGTYGVYATVDGLIEKMEVRRGQECVAVGDIVAAGELLITGGVELKPPEYSTEPSQWLVTAASGAVFARTWRTLEGVIPLTALVQGDVVTTSRGYGWTVLGKTMNFFGTTSIAGVECDKIINQYAYTLMGLRCPLALSETIWTEYQPQMVTVDAEAAQTLVEQALLARLHTQLGETGELLSNQYSAQVVGDFLYVTLTAECHEQIGEVRPMEFTIPTPEPQEDGQSPHVKSTSRSDSVYDRTAD